MLGSLKLIIRYLRRSYSLFAYPRQLRFFCQHGRGASLALAPLRPRGTDELNQRKTSPDTDPKVKAAGSTLPLWWPSFETPHGSRMPVNSPLCPSTSLLRTMKTCSEHSEMQSRRERLMETCCIPSFYFTTLLLSGLPGEGVGVDVPLGSLMGSLQWRLQSAVEQAEPES